jgi:methionine aminopeptidase
LIQAFGHKFNLEQYLSTRDLTIKLCHELSSLIKPGMNEIQAHELYQDLLRKNFVFQSWHPPKIRFGKNTKKSFRELSDDSIVLRDDDLFFIDIGPVFKGHEGDYGETFSFGETYKSLKDASREVFDQTHNEWKLTQRCGVELYEFAQNLARKKGFILNHNMDGHRLSDFPHGLHFKGGLGECEEQTKPYAWVLEIHLIDEKSQRGAFFEDILMP